MQECDIVLGLLFPADEDAAKAVHPTVRAFDYPAPGAKARFAFDSLGFFAPRADMTREAELGHGIADFLVIVAFVQTQALRLLRRWLRPLHDYACKGIAYQFHVRAVGAGDDETDGHALACGQQAALDTRFAAIRRIGAGLFPAQRRFRHRAVHTGKRPVDAFQFIELLNTGLPERAKYIRLHPLLIAIMRRRMRDQFGLIQRLPLTAGAQDVEDGIGTRAIRYAWPATTKTVRAHMRRHERLQDCPQGIGDSKAGCRLVVRARARVRLLVCSALMPAILTHRSCYSDRL